jgi:hypothetical protein
MQFGRGDDAPLVEKTLSPAHQKRLPPVHFGAPATHMPAVMYYPGALPYLPAVTAPTVGEYSNSPGITNFTGE